MSFSKIAPCTLPRAAISTTHVAGGLLQPLRNARKLGVNFFETLLPGEHKMGLKKKFHRRKFF